MANTTDSRDVDAWFARLPEEQRAALTRVREQIRALVPEATECISYQIPTFRHHGALVGLNASKSGLSLITMRPGLVEAMKDSLGGVKASGSTLRFTPARPLPEEVVRAVVLARVEQNVNGE